MRSEILLCAAALLVATGPAWAVEPGDWTAMAVVAPAADNSNTGTGTPYSAPLGGYYYIRTDLPFALWSTFSQAHPNAKDPGMLASVGLQVLTSDNTGSWAKIRATAPGWCKVRAQSGAVIEDVYYRFYRVVILEDQIGGKQGFDPRYGREPNEQSIFTELGGPLKSGEPGAQDITVFDTRWDPLHTVLGFNVAWPGVPASALAWPPPFLDPPYSLVPHPAGYLKPLGGTPLDSLMATTRDEQYVRMFVEGPRDPAPQGIGYDDGFEIAIRMARPFSQATGDIYPGRTAPNGWQIVSRFKPPEPENNTGGFGKWHWPDSWGAAPTQPQIPVVRHNLVDTDEPAVRRKWVLRFPWRGLNKSAHYADIEVEARIPPRPVFSGGGGAKAFGHDSTGMEEGCVQFRWGTVVDLDAIDVETVDPEFDLDMSLLKERWYRLVEYKIPPIAYMPPGSSTPDPNIGVAASLVHVSFGAQTHVNGGTSREPDTATANHARMYTKLDPQDADESGHYYVWEAMQSDVTPFLETAAGDRRDKLWTDAEWPEDALDWVTDGSVVRPKSIGLKYRGYAGQVANSPHGNKNLSAPHAADFDTEPLRPLPTGTTWHPCEKTVWAHFINARADVNNDGLIDVADEADEIEEGADSGPGLLVNGRADGGSASASAAVDPNLRKIEIRFSEPSSHDYAGYAVRIETADGALFFWKDDKRTQLISNERPYVTSLWTIPEEDVPDDGSPISVYVSSTWDGTHSASAVVRIYLTKLSGTDVHRLVMDEIKITHQGWGLTVDMDENQTIDLLDEVVEDTTTNRMRMIVGMSYGLDVAQHEQFAYYGTAQESATVTLRKSGAGRVSVVDDSSSTVFPAPPAAELTEAEITSGLQGTNLRRFSMTGHVGGDVDLTLELAVGQRIISVDVVRLRIVQLEVIEVGFAQDHLLTVWNPATSPSVNDVKIDSPDGTEPVWKKTGNPDHPVCYTKGAKPTIFGKLSVTPSLTRDFPVALRIREAGTGEVVLHVSAIQASGSTWTFSAAQMSGALPDEMKTESYTLLWEVASAGTSAASTGWGPAGTTGSIKFHMINADPVYPPFTNLSQATTYNELYTLAIEKACAYVNGAANPEKAMNSGVEGELTYNPGAGPPSDGHPLKTYNHTAGCFCLWQAALLRGLWRSAGIDGDLMYVYSGWGATKNRSMWVQNSTGAQISLRFALGAHEAAPANPHFTYHAVVHKSGRYYDPSYGTDYTAFAVTEPPGVAGLPLAGESLIVTSNNRIWTVQNTTGWLIDPATGQPWRCPH